MDHYIECPHCKGIVLVLSNEINCQIFRHGIYKNGTPLGPHSSKELCERVFQNGEIWGCGKPFRFDGQNVSVCEYV